MSGFILKILSWTSRKVNLSNLGWRWQHWALPVGPLTGAGWGEWTLVFPPEDTSAPREWPPPEPQDCIQLESSSTTVNLCGRTAGHLPVTVLKTLIESLWFTEKASWTPMPADALGQRSGDFSSREGDTKVSVRRTATATWKSCHTQDLAGLVLREAFCWFHRDLNGSPCNDWANRDPKWLLGASWSTCCPSPGLHLREGVGTAH